MTGNGADISAFGEPRRKLYEAALWTVRLQDRTQGGHAFDTLLKDKAGSDEAYAKVRQVWQDLAELEEGEADSPARPSPAQDVPASRPVRRHMPAWVPSAIAAMLVLFIGAFLLSLQPGGYTTDVGEQRVVELSDGTKVTLNTDTRVSVDFTEQRRGFRIARGEALFEVAHDKSRPFVVEAAGSHVRALGTSFIVRRERGRVDVTLLSGSVEITRDGRKTDKVALLPGERLRVHEKAATIALDRPQIPVVTAWKNGKLILKETPLTDALREINRYNEQKVKLAGGISPDARISGVFRVTDAHAFAESLAEIYQLKIDESPEQLMLRPRLALR